MNSRLERHLKKEAIRLYGIGNKTDMSYKFNDMTLSITYDKPEEEAEEVVEEKKTKTQPKTVSTRKTTRKKKRGTKKK